MGEEVFFGKMTIHLNVLDALMEDKAVSDLDRTQIVIVEWHGSGELDNHICQENTKLDNLGGGG